MCRVIRAIRSLSGASVEPMRVMTRWIMERLSRVKASLEVEVGGEVELVFEFD